MADPTTDALKRERDAAVQEKTQIALQLKQNDDLVKAKGKETEDAQRALEITKTRVSLLERQNALELQRATEFEKLFKYESERNAILDRHIARLRKENAALINEDDDERILELKGRVRALEEETSVDKKKLQTFQKQLNDEKERAKQRKDQEANDKKALDALKQENQNKDKRAAVLDQKVTSLKAQLAARDAQMQAMNDRLKFLQRRVPGLSTELAEHEKQMAAKQAEVNTMDTKISELESKIVDLQAELEDAKAKIAANEQAARSASDLQAKLERDLAARDDTIKRLEDAAAAARTALAEAEAKFQGKSQALASMTVQKQRADESAEQLKAEIMALTSKRANLRTGNADSTTPLGDADYEAHLKHKETMIALKDKEIARLEEVIVQNEETTKRLRSELRKFDSEQVPALKAEIVELKATVTNLESLVAMKTNADEESRTLLSESRIEELSKREALMTAEQELHELQLQLAEAQEVARVESQKAEESSIAMDEMEERWKAAADQVDELTKQNELKESEIAKLTEQLSIAKDNQLAEAQDRLTELDRRVTTMTASLQGRDDRLTIVTQQLEQNRKVMKSQYEQLTEAKEKLKVLQDTDLPLKTKELERLQHRVAELETQTKSQEERIKLLQEKLAQTREDLKQRIQQVRTVMETSKTNEQELLISKERLIFLETQVKTEKAVSRGVEDRLRVAQDAWDKAIKNLDDTWQTIKELEFKVQSSTDALDSKASEHQLASMQAENAASLAKAKDQRLTVLQERMRAIQEDMRAKDERLQLQVAKISKLSDEDYKNKKQLKQMAQTVQNLENELSDARETIGNQDLDIGRLQSEVRSKDEQIQLLNGRVETARAEIDMQMELLKSQMKQTELHLAEKTKRTEATISGLQQAATSQDEKLNVEFRQLTEQTNKLEATLKAKESLVQILSSKLDTATLTLNETKETHSKEAAKLRAKIQSLEQEVRDTKKAIAQQTQERSLISRELDAHREVMDQYSRKLTEAETGSTAKEEQLTGLQRLIDEMRTDLDIHGAKMRKIGAVGDSQQSELEEKLDKLSALYFQTICLLVKTQLFHSGRMQNVLVKDLYEEVQSNKIDFEEWPAFVFTRAYNYSDA